MVTAVVTMTITARALPPATATTPSRTLRRSRASAPPGGRVPAETRAPTTFPTMTCWRPPGRPRPGRSGGRSPCGRRGCWRRTSTRRRSTNSGRGSCWRGLHPHPRKHRLTILMRAVPARPTLISISTPTPPPTSSRGRGWRCLVGAAPMLMLLLMLMLRQTALLPASLRWAAVPACPRPPPRRRGWPKCKRKVQGPILQLHRRQTGISTNTNTNTNTPRLRMQPSNCQTDSTNGRTCGMRRPRPTTPCRSSRSDRNPTPNNSLPPCWRQELHLAFLPMSRTPPPRPTPLSPNSQCRRSASELSPKNKDATHRMQQMQMPIPDPALCPFFRNPKFPRWAKTILSIVPASSFSTQPLLSLPSIPPLLEAVAMDITSTAMAMATATIRPRKISPPSNRGDAPITDLDTRDRQFSPHHPTRTAASSSHRHPQPPPNHTATDRLQDTMNASSREVRRKRCRPAQSKGEGMLMMRPQECPDADRPGTSTAAAQPAATMHRKAHRHPSIPACTQQPRKAPSCDARISG
mmetsp:Transcript_11119/g.32015  ORF Transcript_11119/g.32015 Transcript_11119/m.32015 type:complete len:522 (-) Transcript_11119:1391-2956(-)